MYEDQLETIVIAPPAERERRRKAKAKNKNRRKRQPRYQVILWNDDDHTYDYVIAMMQKLFGHSWSQGFLIAREVDQSGKAICLTTTLEHAELKRDQIHAFGADKEIKRSKGSMWSSIEPEPAP